VSWLACPTGSSAAGSGTGCQWRGRICGRVGGLFGAGVQPPLDGALLVGWRHAPVVAEHGELEQSPAVATFTRARKGGYE
jgi:hypothetical protein